MNKEVREQIKENLEETNWFHIVYWYQLDESFIREYADYMNWKNVGLYQLHLSDEFKREMFIK